MFKNILKINKTKVFAVNKTFLIGVSTIGLLASQNVYGAESDVEIGLTGEGSYDDNRFLSTTNKQAVYIFRINPSVNLIIEDEGAVSTFTATSSYALSSDQLIQQDRFTYGARYVGNYQFEYNTLSLGAGYNRQSLFDTEFDDTGVFNTDAVLDRGDASIGLQFNLNENWNLRLADNFQVMNYSTAVFDDFWSNSATIGIDVVVNEKTSLVQNFSYLRYQLDNPLVQPLNSYSYLAGISHDLSENTSITITGGASRFNGSYRWSAIAEITHELENNQFSLRAARELMPSGLGGLRQSESISFDTSYNYSESTNIGLTASWRRSKDLNNLIQLNNEFIGLSPWVSIEVIRDLRVRLRYQLRRQRIGMTSDWGVSNTFFVSIEY